MLYWLIAVAVLVLIWGLLWRSNLSLAFGVLLGLPIGWLLTRLLKIELTDTDMLHIPVWLPPLPFAIVATTLFVSGAVIWFRAGKPSSSE